MVLPLGCVWEPHEAQGGTQKTPGNVQPHSLLRESVTSEDLHRPKPCFMSPDEDPGLRHPRPPLGRPETWTRPRGKGDAGGALGDCRPSAGGKGSPAPSPVGDLPPSSVLLRTTRGRPWLWAPPMLLPGPFVFLRQGCRPRSPDSGCALVHLRSMVSASVLLRR